MRNDEIVYQSRLVARWSSSYDCIGAQMNDKTKRVIYELSELPWVSIKLMKVRFVRTIAIIDSNADDPSM